MCRDADMTAVVILSHGADRDRILCSDGRDIDLERDVYRCLSPGEKINIASRIVECIEPNGGMQHARKKGCRKGGIAERSDSKPEG